MTTRQDDHRRDPGHCQACGGGVCTDDRSRCRFARGRPRSLAVLLLALGLLLPAPAKATERQATPGPDQEATSQGVTTDHLIESSLEQMDLPCSADTVALTRVTLSPEAAAEALNGAHLFVVEAGALTVQEWVHIPPPGPGTPIPFWPFVAAGPPVTHETGDQFLVGADGPAPPTITNEGAEPAVALVVSIVASGGYGLGELLTGWTSVEPLIAEAPVRVDSLPGTRPHVSLVRVRYDRGASFDFDLDHRLVLGPTTRLLAVESGALNVQADHAAQYRPAGAAPQELPPNARVSLLPGDQLFVGVPGTIATHNVARGPSAALMITISQVSGIVPPVLDGPCS